MIFCGVSSLTFRCAMLKCMASDAFYSNRHFDKTLTRSVVPFTLMAPSRVKKDSWTSGRIFSDGAVEGCEVTGWLYFTSALLVLYLTITFLQVSYLTWPFSSGSITYRFSSPSCELHIPTALSIFVCNFFHTRSFFYSSEISAEIPTVTNDNSNLCLYTYVFHRELLSWYMTVHYRP